MSSFSRSFGAITAGWTLLSSALAVYAGDRIVLRGDATITSCNLTAVDSIVKNDTRTDSITLVVRPSAPNMYMVLQTDSLPTNLDSYGVKVFQGEGDGKSFLQAWTSSPSFGVQPGHIAAVAPNTSLTIQFFLYDYKRTPKGFLGFKCLDQPWPSKVSGLNAEAKGEDGVALSWKASATPGVQYRVTRFEYGKPFVLDTIPDTTFHDTTSKRMTVSYVVDVLKDSLLVPGPSIKVERGALVVRDSLNASTCGTELGLYDPNGTELTNAKVVLRPRQAGQKLSFWTELYYRETMQHPHSVRVFHGTDTSNFLGEISSTAGEYGGSGAEGGQPNDALAGGISKDPSGALTFVYNTQRAFRSTIRLNVACGAPKLTVFRPMTVGPGTVEARWIDNSKGTLATEIRGAMEGWGDYRPLDTIPPGQTHWKRGNFLSGGSLRFSARYIGDPTPNIQSQLTMDRIQWLSDSVVTSCQIGGYFISKPVLFRPEGNQDTLRLFLNSPTIVVGDSLSVVDEASGSVLATYGASSQGTIRWQASAPGTGLRLIPKTASSMQLNWNISCDTTAQGAVNYSGTMVDPKLGRVIYPPRDQEGTMKIYASSSPFGPFALFDSLSVIKNSDSKWLLPTAHQDTVWVVTRVQNGSSRTKYSNLFALPPSNGVGVSSRSTRFVISWNGRWLNLPTSARVRWIDVQGKQLATFEGDRIHFPASASPSWVHTPWGTFAVPPAARQ